MTELKIQHLKDGIAYLNSLKTPYHPLSPEPYRSELPLINHEGKVLGFLLTTHWYVGNKAIHSECYWRNNTD